jgi:hypothetical protein
MEVSLQQMPLSTSSTFLQRCAYLMAQQALVIKAEALATAGHAYRSAYADRVIQNPYQAAANAAIMIVGGVNIIGTVETNADPNLIDSSANDAALFAQIVAMWNGLAGFNSGS